MNKKRKIQKSNKSFLGMLKRMGHKVKGQDVLKGSAQQRRSRAAFIYGCTGFPS